jgi:hypothetical protein
VIIIKRISGQKKPNYADKEASWIALMSKGRLKVAMAWKQVIRPKPMGRLLSGMQNGKLPQWTICQTVY